MNVAQAARLVRLPAKTLRYYDEIGLVSPARKASGYRQYSETDIHRLRFVQRTRGLGFSIADCKLLLSLYDNERRPSREVKALGASRLEQIVVRLEWLTTVHGVLRELHDACDGDDRPDCPILDELAAEPGISLDDVLERLPGASPDDEDRNLAEPR